MTTSVELKSGVVYTVASDFIFVPCSGGYKAAVSPGHKFLLTVHSYLHDPKRRGECFHMIGEETSHVFVIERKYLDRLIEVEK